MIAQLSVAAAIAAAKQSTTTTAHNIIRKGVSPSLSPVSAIVAISIAIAITIAIIIIATYKLIHMAPLACCRASMASRGLGARPAKTFNGALNTGRVMMSNRAVAVSAWRQVTLRLPDGSVGGEFWCDGNIVPFDPDFRSGERTDKYAPGFLESDYAVKNVVDESQQMFSADRRSTDAVRTCVATPLSDVTIVMDHGPQDDILFEDGDGI
jgi:hypothetical protein